MRTATWCGAAGVAVLAACYHGPEDVPSRKLAPRVTRADSAVAVVACQDSLYLQLKRVPVDSLSAREYEQFRIRDAACVQSLVSTTTAPVETGKPRDRGAMAANAPDRSRTCDLQLRRLALYPAELPAQLSSFQLSSLSRGGRI